jgi:hypothetical protein
VLDALEGFTKLEKRSGTLGGSVPLRVAQACVPLLEGNAFGFQIVLARPLRLERALGRPSLAMPADERGALARRVGAAVARLSAQGFLAPAWAQVLAGGKTGGPAWVEGGLLAPRLRLWTGLLVRPAPGLWLRLSGAANRRSVLYEVPARFLADAGRLTPLVVDIVPRPGAPAAFELAGELACLAPLQPGVSFREETLAGARDLGEAHAAFYDAAYFKTKQGESTRKYRRMVARQERAPAEGARDPAGLPQREALVAAEAGADMASGQARCEVVLAGPRWHEVEQAGPFSLPEGPALAPTPGPGTAPGAQAGKLERVLHRNPVPFSATFDGQTLRVEPDAARLASLAAEVELAWASSMGKHFIEQNRGAMWYLTKYFTPHPAGEPHFFVKPWAFTRTPPGWSSLLEGEHGDGYDVMRGVVRTDLFFATPAVFWMYRPGRIEVPAGAPLLRSIPVPRWLLGAGYAVRPMLDAG